MNPDNKGPRKWQNMTEAQFKLYIQHLVDGNMDRDNMVIDEYTQMVDKAHWFYAHQYMDPVTGEPMKQLAGGKPRPKPKPKPKPYIILSRTPLAPVQIGGRCDGCVGGLGMVRYDVVAGSGVDFYCDDCDQRVLKSMDDRDDLLLINVDYTTEIV